VGSRIGHLYLVLRTLICRISGRPNYRLWSRGHSFPPEWTARTRRIAQLIPPGTRIIEFGAGRRQLELFLDPSCRYFPSDFLSRGPGTLICDLNRRPLPDLQKLQLDIAVFAGVLEYLNDLDTVARWLADQVAVCVASYECTSDASGMARAREVMTRTGNGWVSHYSQAMLIEAFTRGGFDLAGTAEWHEPNETGRIFVFQNKSRRPLPVRLREEEVGKLAAHSNDLVSVVIPCHNQAQFLGEAIESVLKQQDAEFEIIVVDDGSSDETAQVAQPYLGVHLVQQSNMGLSAARNAGIRHSRGPYLVFLDADDRLLPGALSAGRAALLACPEAAFTAGWFNWIDLRGEFLRHEQRPDLPADPYLALLQRNYIWMHGVVMYNRWVFDAVGGFDPSLPAAEDYDVYLRITRRFAVCHHRAMVAEYRKHGLTLSADPALMLRNTLRILRAQRYGLRNRQESAAYRRGIRFWQAAYGGALAKRAWEQVRRRGARCEGLRDATVLLRLAPLTALGALGRSILRLVKRTRRLGQQVAERR
jgi:glycosyltransferase involved in cell wall biosynthesis